MQFIFSEQDLIDTIALQTSQNFSNEFNRRAYPANVQSKISHFASNFRAEGFIHGHHYNYNQQDFADAIAFYIREKFHFEAAFEIDFHENHGDYSAVVTVV